MDYFLGEIRIFPWTWAPKDWLICNGTELPIQQYQALAALLGTTYGGNGTTTFGLPDFRGRTPLGWGISQGIQYNRGLQGGAESVTLTTTTMPTHTHDVMAYNEPGASPFPQSNVPAEILPQGGGVAAPTYGAPPASVNNMVALAPDTIGSTGGGQAHPNMQPYIVLNFCISSSGLWPPRN